MTIKLSQELDQYVRRKVSAGKYSSPDAVIAHALRVMRRVERMLPSAEDDLRRELDAGIRDIEAGRVRDWDPEAMKRELLAKVRKAS